MLHRIAVSLLAAAVLASPSATVQAADDTTPSMPYTATADTVRTNIYKEFHHPKPKFVATSVKIQKVRFTHATINDKDAIRVRIALEDVLPRHTKNTVEQVIATEFGYTEPGHVGFDEIYYLRTGTRTPKTLGFYTGSDLDLRSCGGHSKVDRVKDVITQTLPLRCVGGHREFSDLTVTASPSMWVKPNGEIPSATSLWQVGPLNY